MSNGYWVSIASTLDEMVSFKSGFLFVLLSFGMSAVNSVQGQTLPVELGDLISSLLSGQAPQISPSTSLPSPPSASVAFPITSPSVPPQRCDKCQPEQVRIIVISDCSHKKHQESSESSEEAQIFIPHQKRGRQHFQTSCHNRHWSLIMKHKNKNYSTENPK